MFHCIWINDTLFKWGAEFTKSFRSQGESTERLCELGDRRKDERRRSFTDETVAKYVGQRNQMRYVALTCAVAAVAFFLYLNLFGTEKTFCIAEGEVFSAQFLGLFSTWYPFPQPSISWQIGSVRICTVTVYGGSETVCAWQ